MQLDLLVCGSRLEDGRDVQDGSKYARALEAQAEQEERLKAFRAEGASKRKQPKAPLRIVGEDEFLAMLPGRAEAEIKQLKEGMTGANTHRRRALDMGSALAQADAYARRKREAGSSKPLARSSSSAASSAAGSTSAAAAAPSLMWVDKYAPETADDLVGNTAAFERLLYWLQNWDELHAGGPPVKGARGTAKGPKPALPAKGKPATLRADKHNIYARAALLSGAPGIGKSTSARLVAATCGRQVVELNASDKRNAKTLAMSLRPVTSGIRVLTMGGAAGSPMLGAGAGGVGGGRGKHVVIMDEVDGLAGNDDRGGTRELISIIAKTRVPIICICNDRSNTKVRSLLSHCLDLPYTRPRKDAIAKRVASIAQREGLGVDPAAIQVLAEAVGGDVRQVLHTMESWGRRAKRGGTTSAPVLSAITMKAELVSTDKDAILRHTGFSAAEQLLLVGTGESAMRPADRLRQLTELFFVDYDLVPLLLQQNYVPSLSGQRDLSSAAAVSRAAYAAQAFADADVLGSRLRSQGQWGLLPATAALNVRGALAARGGAKMRSSFPEWFAKNSTSNKRRRLLAELSTHMSARVWGLPGRSGLVMDHLSVLRERVFRPLFAASAVSKGAVSDEQAEEMLAAWSDPPAPELWQEGEGDDAGMPPLRRLVRAGVGVMGEYGLSKDDAMESLCELRLGAVVDPRTDINTKTKLAITREYSNLRIRSQALVEEQGVTAAARKRKASRSMAVAAAEGGGSDDEDAGDGDEDAGDEDIDLEAFRSKAKAKTKGRAGSAKKKGRAGSAKAKR